MIVYIKSLFSSVVFFLAAVSICEAQKGGRVLTPREMEVLDTLANHKQKIVEALSTANAALELAKKIQSEGALTKAQLKKLDELTTNIDSFKTELSNKSKAITELQSEMQKTTEARNKAEEAIKQIQDRLAKLEVGSIQERVGKLQKEVETYKYNTRVEVEYFGPAPSRPQPFYKVRVIRITGEPKDQPLLGVKISTSATTTDPATQTTTDLVGFDPKNFTGITGKDGVAIINRPNVKGKPGIHKIEFSFAGDDTHLPSSSGQKQIK